MPGGVTTEVRTYQMYINGEWVASKSAKTFPVYDPSTEEVIAQVPEAGAEDVNLAVAAAKAAFEDGPWATSTAQERGRVLFRLAEKVRANLPALAELECRNTGKPIVEAEYDITDAAPALNITAASPPSGRVRKSRSRQCDVTLAQGTRRHRRTNHSVELSAPHGRVEAGAGHRRGLHLRAQARRADSTHSARVRQLFC